MTNLNQTAANETATVRAKLNRGWAITSVVFLALGVFAGHEAGKGKGYVEGYTAAQDFLKAKGYTDAADLLYKTVH